MRERIKADIDPAQGREMLVAACRSEQGDATGLRTVACKAVEQEPAGLTINPASGP
jgi:hypothetical protein